MRSLALAMLALLFAPVGAAATQRSGPVRVLWNSAPDDIRAGGTWDARVSLLEGPGGFFGAKAPPTIVLTALDSGAERRVRMDIDLSPNTFKANVRFPRAGRYDVAIAGFDPRDPARRSRIGPPVYIPARPPAPAAASTSGALWLWAVVGGSLVTALLAGAWNTKRARMRATR